MKENKSIWYIISSILSLLMMITLILAFAHGLTAKYYITIEPQNGIVMKVNGVNIENLNLTYEGWLNETKEERRTTIKTEYRPE